MSAGTKDAIRRTIKSGVSPTRCAAEFNVSRRAIYDLLGQGLADALDNLPHAHLDDDDDTPLTAVGLDVDPETHDECEYGARLEDGFAQLDPDDWGDE